jgi:hypothetical protein
MRQTEVGMNLVYNPKFGYAVELGFSARDISGNNGNVI